MIPIRPLQLQAMFGALLASSLDHYTPQGFWAAYRDIDGQPINLREHQDAFEFFNVLFDQVLFAERSFFAFRRALLALRAVYRGFQCT